MFIHQSIDRDLLEVIWGANDVIRVRRTWLEPLIGANFGNENDRPWKWCNVSRGVLGFKSEGSHSDPSIVCQSRRLSVCLSVRLSTVGSLYYITSEFRGSERWLWRIMMYVCLRAPDTRNIGRTSLCLSLHRQHTSRHFAPQPSTHLSPIRPIRPETRP